MVGHTALWANWMLAVVAIARSEWNHFMGSLIFVFYFLFYFVFVYVFVAKHDKHREIVRNYHF